MSKELTKQWKPWRVVNCQSAYADLEKLWRGENHVNWCCGALHYWVGQGFASREKSWTEKKTIVKNFSNSVLFIIIIIGLLLAFTKPWWFSAPRRDDNFTHSMLCCLPSPLFQLISPSKWYLFGINAEIISQDENRRALTASLLGKWLPTQNNFSKNCNHSRINWISSGKAKIL